MYNKFVQTSNVSRFLTAVGAIDERGASEACILLVSGDAGHGKTRTGQWWALQQDAVFLRIKAAATPHWVLKDLVGELGEQAPAHNCEKLFAQAVGFLAKDPRPLVVDEVENGLHDIKVLETIRDVSDLTEVPVVFVGREYVWGRLKRYKHFRTRVGARADYGKATPDDVRKCVADLCEVPVADEVIAKIHEDSDGHIREIVKAIKNVERIGHRNSGSQVTAELVGETTLIHDWQRPRKVA